MLAAGHAYDAGMGEEVGEMLT